MINKVLTNLAYLFYPRKICSRSEENHYFNSIEHKRLLEIIRSFHINENRDLYMSLKDEFEKDHIFKNFRDVSLLDWQDRSISFDLSVVEEGELYTVSLYLSILIPFYVIKVQKNKIEFFFSDLEISQMKNSNLESKKIKDLIFDIAYIVESKILYKKFPEELMTETIQDISFQEIGFGKFNMFNAFFNNNLITDEIKNNNTTDV